VADDRLDSDKGGKIIYGLGSSSETEALMEHACYQVVGLKGFGSCTRRGRNMDGPVGMPCAILD